MKLFLLINLKLLTIALISTDITNRTISIYGHYKFFLCHARDLVSLRIRAVFSEALVSAYSKLNPTEYTEEKATSRWDCANVLVFIFVGFRKTSLQSLKKYGKIFHPLKAGILFISVPPA